MDPYRFDEWTKVLAAGASRRAFLVGVLKAGAVAIGLAGAASAQTALADDDDDDDEDDDDDGPPPTCEQRLDRCRQRSSYQTCAQCVAEYEETDCPRFRDSDFSFVQLICRCTSDRYCADGNGCTLDICSSNFCYNVPIGNQLSDCTECRSNKQCPNGGKCCKGRCCPANTKCRTNNQGVGICCEKCGNGQTCCQTITFAGDPNEGREYVLGLNTCVGQNGATFDPPRPTFCCGGFSGRYSADGVGLECEAPRGSLP